MAAIFDFQHTQTSDNICTSPAMLLDTKNMFLESGNTTRCTGMESRCYQVYNQIYSVILPVLGQPF